eukprot:TRINITY_DN15721_c0_g1_i1.p1 TRINITY_DN15721_c0_g1~~TRINITY_DN15721_c0_g1_i1.p1  ORF type:complete len:257 (-),score=38.41 TRINITY_DN15721_c0_g1_i1:63-833(-)
MIRSFQSLKTQLNQRKNFFVTFGFRSQQKKTLFTVQISTPGIIYKPLEPSMIGKALDCVGVSFCNDDNPFTKAHSFSHTQWGMMSSIFVHRAAESQLSFVAINKETGNLEGVLLSEDWKLPPPKLYHQLEDWRPVRAIFNELHTRYKSMRPRIEYGKVIHPLYFTCVRPESRRKGIVTALWEHSIMAAREYNYEKMVTEASTSAAASIFIKLGFKEIASVSFKDFKFEGQNLYANLPESDFGRLALFERQIPSDLY